MDDDRMPHPPFPHPDAPMLDVIVQNTLADYRAGKADVKLAIMHAAVHGWYEGHIEGEDHCPGCTFRGDDPGIRRRLISPDFKPK